MGVLSGAAQDAISANEATAIPPLLPQDIPFQPARDSLFRVGPFNVGAGISSQMSYNDNVTIQSANRAADATWSVSPHIMARTAAGDRNVSLSYGMSYNSYLRNSSLSNIGHDGTASGTWALPKLNLSLSAGFSQSTSPNSDVGALTETKSYHVSLSADHALSEKTSVDVSSSVSFSDYGKAVGYTNALYNSTPWSIAAYVNRTPFPKITMGLGVTLSSVGSSQNGGQLSESAMFRVSYKATGKLNLTASFGAMLSQYGGGVPSTLGPVFSVAGNYTPVDAISVTLEAHRSQQPSAYYGNQDMASTGFSLSSGYRLGPRLSLSVGVGYSLSEYHATQVGVNSSRVDDSVSAHGGLGYTITRHWSAGLSYSYSKNLSNTGGFAYSNNTVGLSTSYEF